MKDMGRHGSERVVDIDTIKRCLHKLQGCRSISLLELVVQDAAAPDFVDDEDQNCLREFADRPVALWNPRQERFVRIEECSEEEQDGAGSMRVVSSEVRQ